MSVRPENTNINDNDEGPNATWLGTIHEEPVVEPLVPPPPAPGLSERLKRSRAFHNTPADKMLIKNGMEGCADSCCSSMPSARAVEWAHRVEADALARAAGVPWLRKSSGNLATFQGHPGGRFRD